MRRDLTSTTRLDVVQGRAEDLDAVLPGLFLDDVESP